MPSLTMSITAWINLLVIGMIVFPLSSVESYQIAADLQQENGDVEDVIIGPYNSSASVNVTIVVGYLMDQLKPPYRVGAISMAINDGRASGLLPGYQFRCD